MKTKLLLVILLLVVVPTAVLSLLASRALRNWEAGLSRDIELAAGAAVEALARETAAEVEDALRQARLIMTDSLLRGWHAEQVREAASRARGIQRFVGEVFVFMNPWGFLYPPTPGGGKTADEEGAGAKDAMERLVSELGRRAAQSRSATDSIYVAADGAWYGFTAVHERKSLYVGYRVDMPAFRTLVERSARSRRRGVFRIVVDWGGGGRGAAEAEGVVVRDSFGGEVRGAGPSASVGSAGRAGRDVVAAGRLRPPFEFVEIRAVLDRPGAIEEMGRSQSRLFGWGIALLGGGAVAGALVVFRLAAEEIRLARARSDFVIGVSHDLRTPLSSMRVLAESLYLGRVSTDEQRKRFLGTIVRESDRLAQLIERVLFLVRYGQGALVCRLKPVSLTVPVTRAVQSIRARFAEESGDGLTAVVTRDVASPSAWVMGDEAALTQVFWNLLDNAVKYSHCGGGHEKARPAVTVRSRTVERRGRWWRPVREWVEVSVEDRGMGIPRRDLHRIFRPYFRSPAAIDANISGVGLGLALCRHVVAAHGGWMEVSSRPGEGSEFRVVLPVCGEPGRSAELAGEPARMGEQTHAHVDQLGESGT